VLGTFQSIEKYPVGDKTSDHIAEMSLYMQKEEGIAFLFSCYEYQILATPVLRAASATAAATAPPTRLSKAAGMM